MKKYQNNVKNKQMSLYIIAQEHVILRYLDHIQVAVRYFF